MAAGGTRSGRPVEGSPSPWLRATDNHGYGRLDSAGPTTSLVVGRGGSDRRPLALLDLSARVPRPKWFHQRQAGRTPVGRPNYPSKRTSRPVASATGLGESETNFTTEPWSAVEWIADADLTRASFYWDSVPHCRNPPSAPESGVSPRPRFLGGCLLLRRHRQNGFAIRGQCLLRHEG
jgi:hypothetical protein